MLIKVHHQTKYLQQCHFSPETLGYRTIKLTRANLYGNQLAQTAYAKGVDAAGYANLSSQAVPTLTATSQVLSQYASWRFAFSIIKGERSRWDERDRWWVNYLGITHLFVVSGLHVGFVCVLALLLVRAIWWLCPAFVRICPRRALLEWCVGVPACIGYAVWSGAGEPAIRAAIMAMCFLSLRLLFHKMHLVQVLLLCAWLMLLVWPGRIINPSFWLSFGFVGLLVLCVSKLPNLGKALSLQTLLSIFALLFTLGWQAQLSVLTVGINLVLVPFVAFVWFPVSILAWAEANMWQSSALYGVLDPILMTLFHWLQPWLYQAPSIMLKNELGLTVKFILIVLALVGVLWLPLKKGWVLIIGACLSVCWLPYGSQSGRVWQRYGDQFVEIESHPGLVPVITPVAHRRLNGVLGAFNPNEKYLAHQALAQNWDFVLLSPRSQNQALLESLKVLVVTVQQGERIHIHTDQGKWQVRSSACYQLLNLLKTVACEHAESLESVLN